MCVCLCLCFVYVSALLWFFGGLCVCEFAGFCVRVCVRKDRQTRNHTKKTKTLTQGVNKQANKQANKQPYQQTGAQTQTNTPRHKHVHTVCARVTKVHILLQTNPEVSAAREGHVEQSSLFHLLLVALWGTCRFWRKSARGIRQRSLCSFEGLRRSSCAAVSAATHAAQGVARLCCSPLLCVGERRKPCS